MRLFATAFSIVVSFHWIGEASASIFFIGKGERMVVTTSYIPWAGLEYWPVADSEAGVPSNLAAGSMVSPDQDSQPKRLTAIGIPATVAPQNRKGGTPRAATGGNAQSAMLCNRGMMQMQTGHYREAIVDFEAAIRISPKNQRAYMLRGVAAARQGNHEEALGYYDRSVKLGFRSPEIYQSRGLSYMKLKRFKEALDDFSQAVSLDPDFEEGYVKRGLVYGRLGEFEKSVADNTKAIAINPKNPLSYNNRAAAYKAMGKVQAAEADIQMSKDLEQQGKGK